MAIKSALYTSKEIHKYFSIVSYLMYVYVDFQCLSENNNTSQPNTE